jgi:hypothetical protein
VANTYVQKSISGNSWEQRLFSNFRADPEVARVKYVDHLQHMLYNSALYIEGPCMELHIA